MPEQGGEAGIEIELTKVGRANSAAGDAAVRPRYHERHAVAALVNRLLLVAQARLCDAVHVRAVVAGEDEDRAVNHGAAGARVVHLGEFIEEQADSYVVLVNHVLAASARTAIGEPRLAFDRNGLPLHENARRRVIGRVIGIRNVVEEEGRVAALRHVGVNVAERRVQVALTRTLRVPVGHARATALAPRGDALDGVVLDIGFQQMGPAVPKVAADAKEIIEAVSQRAIEDVGDIAAVGVCADGNGRPGTRGDAVVSHRLASLRQERPAEMPLAEGGRAITALLEGCGESGPVGRNHRPRIPTANHTVLVVAAPGVTTGQQGVACGRTHGRAGMHVGEQRAHPGQAIEVRRHLRRGDGRGVRPELLAEIRMRVAHAHVVGHEDDDVGRDNGAEVNFVQIVHGHGEGLLQIQAALVGGPDANAVGTPGFEIERGGGLEHRAGDGERGVVRAARTAHQCERVRVAGVGVGGGEGPHRGAGRLVLGHRSGVECQAGGCGWRRRAPVGHGHSVAQRGVGPGEERSKRGGKEDEGEGTVHGECQWRSRVSGQIGKTPVGGGSTIMTIPVLFAWRHESWRKKNEFFHRRGSRATAGRAVA